MSEDKPLFFVVGGPSGGGKSTWFKNLTVDTFNIDDRAAVLNGGSYIEIDAAGRDIAFQQLQSFAADHFRRGISFATETTLRTTWIFPMMERASQAGFDVGFTFVAAESPEIHIERVQERGERGGHSAEEAIIRDIYTRCMANLPMLFEAVDRGVIRKLIVYDNSGRHPELLLVLNNGFVEHLASNVPLRLAMVVDGTAFSVERLRKASVEERPVMT